MIGTNYGVVLKITLTCTYELDPEIYESMKKII